MFPAIQGLFSRKNVVLGNENGFFFTRERSFLMVKTVFLHCKYSLFVVKI